MEVDVKIREVSSWGIKVLLRNEASESNTSAATTWITNPRTIRLCPPNPALFFGTLLIEILQLPNLRQSFFRGKNLIKFSHAFSFPNKRISSNSIHEFIFPLHLCFFEPKCSFPVRRGSDLHTPPWQWLLVRSDINESSF